MTFEDCIEIILKHEGGYSNSKVDPGGETNFGICKRSYPTLNIKALTRDQAIEIYRKDFWEKLKIDELPANLRLMFFDSAVNQGPSNAKKFWVQAKDAENPLQEFAKLRMQHYASLPGWSRYGSGWSKRLVDVTLKSVA